MSESSLKIDSLIVVCSVCHKENRVFDLHNYFVIYTLIMFVFVNTISATYRTFVSFYVSMIFFPKLFSPRVFAEWAI
ncbi:hypothetical protein MNBD_NITROSPINAE02-2163 [hydrothermal vent metagenome]|uniref:Uncharacterized protein n=1 Tax=hydrothermal vent metagenome TaxID=652676 RepID=A0A3B1CAJ1_9ZZZZ